MNRTDSCKEICWSIHHSKKTDFILGSIALVSTIITILAASDVLKLGKGTFTGIATTAGVTGGIEVLRIALHSCTMRSQAQTRQEEFSGDESGFRMPILGEECGNDVEFESAFEDANPNDFVAVEDHNQRWVVGKITSILPNDPQPYRVTINGQTTIPLRREQLRLMKDPRNSLVGREWDFGMGLDVQDRQIQIQCNDIVLVEHNDKTIYGKVIQIIDEGESKLYQVKIAEGATILMKKENLGVLDQKTIWLYAPLYARLYARSFAPEETAEDLQDPVDQRKVDRSSRSKDGEDLRDKLLGKKFSSRIKITLQDPEFFPIKVNDIVGYVPDVGDAIFAKCIGIEKSGSGTKTYQLDIGQGNKIFATSEAFNAMDQDEVRAYAQTVPTGHKKSSSDDDDDILDSLLGKFGNE